jgi:hypothetical protein
MQKLHEVIDGLLEIILFHYSSAAHNTHYSLNSIKSETNRNFLGLDRILGEIVEQSTAFNDDVTRPLLNHIIETILLLAPEIYPNNCLDEATIKTMQNQLIALFSSFHKLSFMSQESVLQLSGGVRLHGFLEKEAYTAIGDFITTRFANILKITDDSSSETIDAETTPPSSFLINHITDLFASYKKDIEAKYLKAELDHYKQRVAELEAEKFGLEASTRAEPVANQAKGPTPGGKPKFWQTQFPANTLFQAPSVAAQASRTGPPVRVAIDMSEPEDTESSCSVM